MIFNVVKKRKRKKTTNKFSKIRQPHGYKNNDYKNIIEKSTINKVYHDPEEKLKNKTTRYEPNYAR